MTREGVIRELMAVASARYQKHAAAQEEAQRYAMRLVGIFLREQLRIVQGLSEPAPEVGDTVLVDQVDATARGEFSSHNHTRRYIIASESLLRTHFTLRKAPEVHATTPVQP